MPRAIRGRFKPLDHFVLGHLSILAPLSALGSPHAAKRFIGVTIVVRRRLTIVVRWKDRGSRIKHRSHEHRATLARTSLLRGRFCQVSLSQAGALAIYDASLALASRETWYHITHESCAFHGFLRRFAAVCRSAAAAVAAGLRGGGMSAVRH